MKSLMVLGGLAALFGASPSFAQDAPNTSGEKPKQNNQRFEAKGGIGLLPGMPMMIGARRGQPAKFGAIDPSHYQAMPLLLRNDVRGELRISIPQREAINELVKKDSPIGGVGKPIRIEAKGGDPGDIRKQIEQAMFTSIDESNKTVEALLSREQIQRLREIDLQWRGGLAIADAKVAESLNLSGEQRAKAAEYLQAYREEQNAITMEVYKDFMQTQEQNNKDDNGGDRKMISMRIAIPERSKMTPAQRLKFDEMEERIERVRKTQNEKALALLTPEQKAAWVKMQSKPLTFRVHD